MTVRVEDLVAEGFAALRAGDAARAREVLERARAESPAGPPPAVIEGLARAAYLEARSADAMGAYQRTRDARTMPIYEFTTQLATLEPPPPEVQQLLAAIHGHPAAMNAFVSVIAGTMSPVDFFAPDHIDALLAAAAPA